ncbi:MAG: 5'/3'-nucleotidase SurE [Desulfobacterales bacterium]
MNILITNDDGIYFEGLWALQKQFHKKHQVTVVAPDRERSAIGHAITLHDPLRVIKTSINGSSPCWAVSGTPVDCVKLGILEILKKKPDIVISGINPGANVGININYSGTVSAAKEATLYGISAIAVSVNSRNVINYNDVAAFVEKLVERAACGGLPFGTFLNVNFPDLPMRKIAGVKICRQSTTLYTEFIEKRKDPRNNIYYWQGFDTTPLEEESDLDIVALSRNYISITPIKCDMTDYQSMEKLRDLNRDFKQGGFTTAT